MNENREKLYSYSYLLVVSLIFSALATEIFLLYLFTRENSWTEYELVLVGILSCTFFSALGQKLSKVNDIGRWIFVVSACSSTSYYYIFAAPMSITRSLWQIPTWGVFFSSVLGYGFWLAINIGWEYLSERKIGKKFVAVILGSAILCILVIVSISVYSTEIISFFDSHPWFMTLIGVLITLFGGIAIGRRTKKS